ncbi:MAG: hypothetical protein PHY48_05205 [Candidatus Cloacimonetes bacterium]|nr:hypothetical protein [Candidatus Cloacimonadota bacterium]
MRKLPFLYLFLIIANMLGAVNPKSTNLPIKDSPSKQFYPILYLDDYYPILNNRIDVYKFNKGLNVYKLRPYEIPAFAPVYKERIDYPARTVYLSVLIGDYKIADEVAVSFDDYFLGIQYKIFHKSLLTSLKAATQQTQVSSSGLIKEFVLDIPAIAIPRAVQKVLGNKAGRLNLDGTQKLTLQGSSTKRKQIPIYETQQGATFDLKMEQETNLRLSGTIGEKIAVNLKYNSKQDEQIFDANNVNVKYTGNEDEFIKSIEGGNISLALSGSRYVSYSTSSQGLFGVTSKFKYGNLDLSVIASKEESQKNTQSYIGQSQADSTNVRSKDYSSRNMYYLVNPYKLYMMYAQGDAGIPEGWKNNAIITDPSGAWLIAAPDSLPANGSVRLFMDDASASNNIASAPGDIIYFSPSNYYEPYYDELIEGTDFVTDYSSGTISILRNIDRLTTLAVTYTRRDGTPVPYVKPSQQNDGRIHPYVIRRRNQEYTPGDPNSVWHFQMRNIYDMHKTNIKNEGFNLQIYTENIDRTRNYNLPDSIATAGFLTFTDYLRMDSNGDGLINGDDTTVNLTSGLVIMPFIEPFKPLGDGIVYQEENESVSYQDISFYIGIKGKIGRDAIELAQGGILKGSVKVRVNGNDQRENIDYIVDYDFGRITFLTPAGKDPDSKIEIDFEFRSTFDVAKKTLAGIRADWQLTDYAKLGGTMIYRSENVADKRPRIGNENIEMWMGNVDGSLNFKPAFITKWIDALPLIKSTSPSQINLSGEVAFTLPNIYGDPSGKKKESYIDDMESIMDSYPLGVTFSSWVMASKPYGTPFSKGRINWYNPKNIRREMIEDASTLTERERTETVTVLALKAFRNNLGMPGASSRSWAGVMKYLGNQLDFSQKKYIEVLLKLDTPSANVNLHIDMGDILEDFYTEFGGYNVLNSEDINKDGVLTLDEDIGLDGISFGQPGADPNDVAESSIDQYGDYPRINGSEGNRILDTEDLDGNGVLNKLDRYYTYSFSISDTTSSLIENTNKYGWRLFRIPVTDPAYYRIVNNSGTNVAPSLRKISYVRIWAETDQDAKVLIADMSLIGNKWQDFNVRNFNNTIISATELSSSNTSYLSGIVNNQKNRAHYSSPAGTVYIEDSRESSESALTLSTTNLKQGQQCLLRQRMYDAYNLLSYNSLRFWVYPEGNSNTAFTNPDSLDVIFRIGADSLNYYQVRQRIPVVPYETKMNANKWVELDYQLQDMIALKIQNPDALADSLVAGNKVFYFKGRPTLTNIRDIYLGIYNPHDHFYVPYTGTVYYDDMRVINPYQDMGVASRVSLSTSLADLATINVDYEAKSENFNPIIQRGRQNAYTRTQTLNISNKIFLQKFLPSAWSLDMPLSLARNYTLGIPRYRANSDVLRSNIDNDLERDRERNENLMYSADFGLSQRTAPKNKILLYTLYRTSLSARFENSFRYAPTSVDTTLSYRGTLNYNLSLPSELSSFALYKRYRLGFLPNTWNNSFTFNNTEPNSWNWEKRDDAFNWYPRSQTIATRLLTTDNNISWSLLSDLTATARYNTKRDLMQKQYWQDVNIGKMSEFVQDLGLNFNPNYLPQVFTFTAVGTARFTDAQRKYYEQGPEGQVEVFQSDGNANRSLRISSTLQNATILSAWAQKIKSKKPATVDKPKPKDEPTIDDKHKENEGEQPELDDEKQKKEEEERRIEEEKRLEEEKRIEDPKYKQEMKELEEQKRLENPQYDQEMKELEEKQRYLEEKEKKQSEYSEEELKKMASESGEEKPDVAVSDAAAGSAKPKAPKYGLLYGLVNNLSRIKNITASYQNGYVMNYSRKTDTLPFAFQLGLPHSVPSDFLDATTDDNTITFGSGLSISRNIDSIINYSYTTNKRLADASNQSIGYTFPDITISLMNFESWVGLQKYMSGTRINTGFQNTVRQNGDLNWVNPKQETKTMAFNPILGFSGSIMKVINTNLSFSTTHTENITEMDSYQIIKTSDNQSLNGNVSYSFRAGRGFTIPFTKRKIHINNELSSSLAIAYNKSYDVTQGRENSQVDRSTTRLAFTPGATYQFDQNIRGGLTSSYEITTDKKRDDGTTMFSLGIWVEVNL